MQPIQVYQTDDQGLYLPTVDPIMTDVLDGHHLIPAGCKIKQPPPLAERQAARTLSAGVDADWEVVADWRGYTCYTPDGERHDITEVGVEPPAGHSPTKPPPTAKQLAERRTAEIKTELAQIDADGARPAREIAIALASGSTPPAAAVTKVTTLETAAQALRSELATLAGVL
jgi:hypothetical protein